MNKTIYTTLLAAGLLLPTVASGRVKDLLPTPKQVALSTGESPFALGRAVVLADPTDCPYLQRVLTEYGCTVSESAGAKVTVELVPSIDGAFNHNLPDFPDEAYQLTVTADAINIKAVTKTGVFRAAQTLQQLAEGYEGAAAIEAVAITDWPAFKLRGFMQDIGRSFISFSELKNEIDKLARFKVNVFHWHLTEKTGWRFEVKAYPQLTTNTDGVRYPGKYYTQAECRELVAYAAERGVTIIPEIDMPGHSAVFTKAMGFDMQSDQGVAALKKILDEVCEVFSDAPYIHIGGDEVNITYPDFLEIMSAYVRNKGHKVVLWNPLQNKSVTSSIADMIQLWSTRGKVIPGIPSIDCRYNYTNHFDVYADLVGIYKSNIYYAERGTDDIAGTISAAWNDTKTETETDIIRQNNIYANILASAERAWKGGGKQYIEAGGTTLPNSGAEYDEFADFEARFLFHKAHSLSYEPIAYVRQSNVRWRITDPMPNNGNKAAALPPESSADDVLPTSFTYKGATYTTRLATGGGIYLRHIWHPTVPSFFSAPANNQTAYAWTYVYSPVEQEAGAQIETYTYSRSGSEKMPPAGEWDRRGSKIWVNGEAVAAPKWKQPDADIPQDDLVKGLTNENLTARDVVRVRLREGWNKVFLRLPHVNSGGTARDKWQFTFVLTDTEGRNALDGIVYSPSKSMDFAEDLKIEERVRAEEQEYIQSLVPKLSTADKTYWYKIRTPLRDNRYPTSKGAGAELVGETASGTDASTWKFVSRADGAFNIVNKSDGTFVSPNSASDTALRTVDAEPSAGWSFKPAATAGYVIIVSGTAQFNQTNTALGAKVYNWGGGVNTDDPGCQYAYTLVGTDPAETPKLSTSEMSYWYQMSTPLRDNRYPTSKGAGKNLVGEASPSEAATWKFETRADGTFNIVNRADGTYVSPDSPDDTALKTVSDEPEAGWSFLNASTYDYFCLVSGTAQFNQTKSGQGYEVYNWGSGTQTTDTGCQYSFVLVDQEGDVMGILPPALQSGDASAVYDLSGRRVHKTDKKGVYIVNGRKILF